MGVSRAPVSGAFQILSDEGLIELRMNKGAIVKPVDEKFIKDYFGIRVLLGGEAVARAIKHNFDTSALLVDTRPSSGTMEKSDYQAYNLQFHATLW